MLFDLYFDPDEVNNLTDNPGRTEVLEDMRNRLDRFMRETDDPLLAGHVTAPSGARLNNPDGASPRDVTITAP